MTGAASVKVISFGYGHAGPPPAHLTVDLREHFRDPHVDPELRCLTAADPRVKRAVAETSGIPELTSAVVTAVLAYRLGPVRAPVTVAVGCTGGRHRSAAVAEAVARMLTRHGIRVDLVHRDIGRPVIERAPGGQP